MYYQVIVTDKQGTVGGQMYDKPVAALQTFARYLMANNSYKVMFHKTGLNICTLDSKNLSYGVVTVDNKGNQHVEFYANYDFQDILLKLKQFKEGYKIASIYVRTAVIVDLKTAEIAKVYQTEESDFDVDNI